MSVKRQWEGGTMTSQTLSLDSKTQHSFLNWSGPFLSELVQSLLTYLMKHTEDITPRSRVLSTALRGQRAAQLANVTIFSLVCKTDENLRCACQFERTKRIEMSKERNGPNYWNDTESCCLPLHGGPVLARKYKEACAPIMRIAPCNAVNCTKCCPRKHVLVL